MNFAFNLKQKSALFIVGLSLLTFFISWGLIKAIYLETHARFVENSYHNLMQHIENDIEHLDEAIEWSSQQLNVPVYLFENLDELKTSAFLNDFDTEGEILTQGELQKLEEGHCVVKYFTITEMNIKLMSIFHPLVENEQTSKIIATYTPVNNSPESSVIPLIMSILGVIVFSVTMILAKKSFGKSYNQLQDIKSAVAEVSKGNFDAKVRENSTDEIGEITETVNQMATELKTNRERIKEFMEDVSHEIKTPLTYIKTYNQALMDEVISDPQEQQKSFRLIDRETNRMQRMIQNVLDFTKLDADAVELNKQPIVFAQNIEEMMIKYEPIFQQQHIQCEMDLNYDVIIDADEERLEQIIQNIIQNAIRYSKENPRIELKLEKQVDKCILSISDNGVGISKEHLAVITNRFVRVNKVRSRKESGTGIGLSIVEKLMTLHGGEMQIESELGVGTTFKLIFPCID